MNRIALLWLMVATLVGCSGGSKSVPNVPDPEPESPLPATELPDRHSDEGEVHFGGTGTASSDSTASGPVQPEVDWIELLTPPFQHNETEEFLLHLASPADELTWRTESRDYVHDVDSDQGGTSYIIEEDDEQALIYRTWTPYAGLTLSCFSRGYEEVKFECNIRRDNIESIVSATSFPRHAPPAAGSIRHYGIVGVSGQERIWNAGTSSSNEFEWDFGGGTSPNLAQGPQSVPTVLGGPGLYIGNYKIRNEWGASGPQQFSYRVQAPWSTYSLNISQGADPSLLVVDDRIRMLVPKDEGYQYAEALTPTPDSLSDWHFSDLPLPESHTYFMRLGAHAERLLVVGGQGQSGSEDVLLYYRASAPSPQSAEDWDVGGIPSSAGLEVIDLVIDPERVGLLALQASNLVLLWDDTPVLSQWRISAVAQAPSQYNLSFSRLMLPESGPVVVGFNQVPGEPYGLKYRSASWDALDAWSAHRILDLLPTDASNPYFLACIYQERPLVLTRLDRFSSVMLLSNEARPQRSSNWERLQTCHELTVPDSVMTYTHLSENRIVMSPVSISTADNEGNVSTRRGGLFLDSEAAQFSQWTPFLTPSWSEGEFIVATVLTSEGVGALTRKDGVLRFGMLTP